MRTVSAFAFWLPLFLVGLAMHAISGRTPPASYNAMRRLYAPTRGLFNELALRAARLLRPAPAPTAVSGFLGTLGAEDIARLVARLDVDGIAMFERELPEAMCEQLLSLARRTPSMPLGSSVPEIYAPERASALRYDFAEQDILSEPIACRLALDGTFAAIAGAYFRCRPIYDFSAMWWTTPAGRKDYSAAAQEFHFDMDRLSFLKFFVYLSDVGEANGPHVFVAGSHKDKPAALREPVRFDDAQVERHYPGAARSIVGRRGTIFAADTSGIHKGMPVVSGDRLLFQVEFATSLFGQRYPHPTVSREVLAKAGIAALDADVYRNVSVRD